jgi:hypothetical protein
MLPADLQSSGSTAAGEVGVAAAAVAAAAAVVEGSGSEAAAATEAAAAAAAGEVDGSGSPSLQQEGLQDGQQQQQQEGQRQHHVATLADFRVGLRAAVCVDCSCCLLAALQHMSAVVCVACYLLHVLHHITLLWQVLVVSLTSQQQYVCTHGCDVSVGTCAHPCRTMCVMHPLLSRRPATKMSYTTAETADLHNHDPFSASDTTFAAGAPVACRTTCVARVLL